MGAQKLQKEDQSNVGPHENKDDGVAGHEVRGHLEENAPFAGDLFGAEVRRLELESEQFQNAFVELLVGVG